jgi:hypothetical protein
LLLSEDVAMEVEAYIDVSTVLHSFATPYALVVFRQTGQVREALRLNSGFRLTLGKAIRAGRRTAGRRRSDGGRCSSLIELLRHRQMLSQVRQCLDSPGFEVVVVAPLRIAAKRSTAS